MKGPSMTGFGKTLAGSVILHAALLAAVALLFASGAGKVFITPVYTVDLVAQGPRPGPAPVAEAVKEEPAPAPEPVQAAPKPEPLKVSPEALKVKEKPSVDDALKKLEKKVERRKDEALVASSIDDLKKKMETERQERNERVSRLREEIASRTAPAAKPREAAPASRQASAAINPAGGAPKADLERKYPAYYGVIRDKVQDNWIYPEGLKDGAISVIVSIKIARTGKLLDVSVEKSSGDQAFDASLLKAVKKAAPFPPLPIDLEGSFLETGLRFCPGCAQ